MPTRRSAGRQFRYAPLPPVSLLVEPIGASLEPTQRIAGIALKLRSAAERKLRPFGVEAHGFRVLPPVPEVAIANFEATHRVVFKVVQDDMPAAFGHWLEGAKEKTLKMLAEAEWLVLILRSKG